MGRERAGSLIPYNLKETQGGRLKATDKNAGASSKPVRKSSRAFVHCKKHRSVSGFLSRAGVLVFTTLSQRRGGRRLAEKGKGVLSPSSLGKLRTPRPISAPNCAATGSFLHLSGPQCSHLESGGNSTHSLGFLEEEIGRRCESICSPPGEREDGGQVPFYGTPKKNTCL